MSLFPLGNIVATPGALAALNKNGQTPDEFIQRHVSGDWGDLCDKDKKLNDEAVRTKNDRVFTAYSLKDGSKIWVITEWDRSVTTVLLPEDY
jgi:hypothetical protein